MLGIMRKYKQSIVIKVVFAIIVFSFIGTIFLVWGRGTDKSGSSLGYAAKVDGTKIGLEDYQQAYYRLRGIYEQIYQRSLTPEMEKQLGIKKMALDNLVDSVLMRKAAKKMNISVSKDEIATAIAAIPAFQKNGAFDFQQYQQALKGNRMTASDFEETQKNELTLKKARKSIEDKATVSDTDAETYYHRQNDKLELQYAVFTPDSVRAEVTLTDQDLTSYLQSHQEQFKTPEQISIQYVMYDPATVTGKVTVTDEEVQTFYQKNIDRYQGKGGILPLAEVKEKVKADTVKFKAGKVAYENAADIINKNISAANLQAVATGLGSKINETALFASKTPPANLATEEALLKKAFLLKQGEMAGPIETAKGIYAVKLKERKPAEVPPLAQIKAAVEAKTKEDKAKELASKKAGETLAALGKGNAAVKLLDTGSFSFNDQGNIPGIGVSKEAMDSAFTLTSAAPLPKTPFKLADKWVVFKLKNRIQASKDDYQKSKEEIRKALLPKKQQEAVEAWLKGLRAAAKIELNQQLIAE